MSAVSPTYDGKLYTRDVTERLRKLVSVTSQMDPSRSISEQNSVTVNTCLQTVERLLDVPTDKPERASLRGERIPRSEAGWCTQSPASKPKPNDDLFRQLRGISETLTTLTREFQKRRSESRRVNSVFQSKYTAVSQEAQLLKHVVRTAKADAEKADIKLEGLNGTVRGFETWFREWKARYDGAGLESWEMLLHPRKQKADATQIGILREEVDTLVDGIGAWLRGWKDVEEAFYMRPR